MCAQSGAAPTGAASDSSGVFLTPSYSGFYRLFPLHTLSRTQVRCPPEHHILSFFRLVTSHRSGSKAANAAARSRAALWPGFFALLVLLSEPIEVPCPMFINSFFPCNQCGRDSFDNRRRSVVMRCFAGLVQFMWGCWCNELNVCP